MKTIEREEAATKTRVNFQGKDILQQVLIAALAVAPDGSSVVYVRRTVEDGKYVRRVWRTNFEGAAPEQLTSAKANDGRPPFSPDGRRLVFISDRSGKPQAWVINLAGGEARQITGLEGGGGQADWSPDGTRLLLLGGSGEKRFIVGKPEDPTARRILDYTWRLDGAGIRDEHSSVWVTEVDDPKPKRVTDPSYNVSGVDWSPDGEQVAFLADMSSSAGLEEIPAVWTVSAEGGQPKEVARLEGAIFNVSWGPGGKIAYTGVSHEGSPVWAEVELPVAGKGRGAHP